MHRYIGRCKVCKTTKAIEKDVRRRAILVPCDNGCKVTRRGHRMGVSVRLVRIEGTYNEHRTCDARCMNAVGPKCDCQCGGHNHSAAHIPVAA